MGYYQRLRDLKEDSDLTQKQVAEIIGVSVNHYGKYGRGETDIPFEKVILLADYYNASLDYIAGRTNRKTDGELSDDERKFTEQYRMLSERSRGRLDILMQQLLEQQINENNSAKK